MIILSCCLWHHAQRQQWGERKVQNSRQIRLQRHSQTGWMQICFQKIVVSYLVLRVLLESCLGSTTQDTPAWVWESWSSSDCSSQRTLKKKEHFRQPVFFGSMKLGAFLNQWTETHRFERKIATLVFKHNMCTCIWDICNHQKKMYHIFIKQKQNQLISDYEQVKNMNKLNFVQT